jgi:RNA polymerase sigma-70 factor (ECF subfamily)
MAKGESDFDEFSRAENIRDASAGEGADKLVSRAAGDAAAFALLYDIYYERIFSYCVSRVRFRQSAEDLTSAAFLAAAENISKFRGEARTEFANWLYIIATAKTKLYLRKKQVIERLTAAEAQESRSDEITWPILHNAILKLALKEQTIIALRFFENFTADRIAEIMGSRPDTVRLRIARAIENIKMFGTEKQFEDIVKKLDIDNTPDAAHKEKLRSKILAAFDSAGRKKHRVLLYSLTAAIVLITAGLALWFYPADKIPLPLRHIVKFPKPAAEVNLVPQQEGKSRLENIKQLAAEKNIPELLKILKSDDLTARLLAAKYLAELTDSNTADIVKIISPAGSTPQPSLGQAGAPFKEKQADSNKPTAQRGEEQKTILITTTDKKTNLPLADVALQIRLDGKKEVIEGITDANGQYILTLPTESLNQFQISATKEDYARMMINRYGSGQAKLFLPEAISFEMSLTIEVGGIVRNEELEPIEGAEVKLLAGFRYDPENPHIEIGGTFKTDANGLWKCDLFPEDACQASIITTHPNYVSQEGYRPAIVEELKNFSFVTTLEKGIAVTGGVFDWEQRPVQAAIIKGADGRENPVICDANGWFRFDNIAPSIEVFTVQYKGAAPQIQQVDIGPNMSPIIFNLEPANTIRAKVVDINGTPLKDVYVKTESWKGFSSLNFEAGTDANGFFQWTEAPADEVLFSLYKPGYMHISSFGMTSKSDYVITLLPPFRISGAVTSSDPNRAVGIFEITQGIYRDSAGQILWQKYGSAAFSNSRYELTITEPNELQLKVQADGFEGAESPIFSPEQGAAEYDFVLTPMKADHNDTIKTQ